MSEKFSQRWNFPNTIGAIDGEHIVLKQLKNLGPLYHNYKGSDSIILMAVVGPKYQLLYTEVGMNGKNSEGGAYAQSPLRKTLKNNILNLPKLMPLSSDLEYFVFVSVGDGAFPLSTYMMKRYL